MTSILNYKIPRGKEREPTPKLPASTEVNVSEIFKRAKSHLERGSKNAILGQYRTAYNDYDCGLRALSQAIEVESNPDKKNSMKNILLQYLKRAVDVKQQLEGGEEPKIVTEKHITPSDATSDNTNIETTMEEIKIVQTENFEYKVIYPGDNKSDVPSSVEEEGEVKLSTPSMSEIIASMEETKIEQGDEDEQLSKKHRKETKSQAIQRKILEVCEKKNSCKVKKKTRVCRATRRSRQNNINTTPIKVKMGFNRNRPTWDNEFETTPIHLMKGTYSSKKIKSVSSQPKKIKLRTKVSPRIRSSKRISKNNSNKNITKEKYKGLQSKVHSNYETRGQNKQNSRSSGNQHESSKFESIVNSEIMHGSAGVTWDDVAGLTLAKHTLQEAVILPMLRPDIFNGIRAPSKGVLLYGPPGTGKTMLAKAVATESNATFFSISASSLTSKWVGESSKLVRALFDLANKKAPSVVFIDEIDSMLTKRKSSEHNGGRQLKTEFLVQFDGARTSERKGHVLIIGATNRPWDLDEAVLRRLAKRVHIPLPDEIARRGIIENLMCQQHCEVTEDELNWIIQVTQNYSGSDLKALCHEAALGPLRGLGDQIANIDADEVRPIDVADFEDAIKVVRPSVQNNDRFKNWTSKFGTSC
jgi:SpoVK/Ycf46/Vps4 family AAA+-type ATPase